MRVVAVITSVSLGPATPAGGVSVKAVECLGLKLEKRRLPIEVVVDKIARTSTEN